MPTPTVNFPAVGTSRPATRKTLHRTSDGDTPVIEQPIRMVSCDTPEKAGYAGKPEMSQPRLNGCRARLEGAFYAANLPHELRDYLVAKLTPTAAADHIAAGDRATSEFERLLEQRLTRPSGTKRGVAVIPTGEIVDRYGRLLAYIAPWFSGSSSDPLPPRDSPERRTFNLDMIENGWAAFFPIYPSLPRNNDMNLAIAAAEQAWDSSQGIWQEFGKDVLLGYEFRACIKLAKAQTAAAGIRDAFQRICVDLRDLRIVGKLGFPGVPPPYRLWVWEEDIAQARIDLGLVD